MPSSAIRCISAHSSTSPDILALSSWWGLATVPILALLFGIRIGIEEQTLRTGLEGYDDYGRRVRWRLIPFIW